MNIQAAISSLLIGGAFLLPFSIAVSNALFCASLTLAVLAGIWWKQIIDLWNRERVLIGLLAGYVIVTAIGILWSLNRPWGLHILAKQWSWALLPLIFLLSQTEAWRSKLLFAISCGLTLHLLVSFLQIIGYPIPLNYPAGSSKDDPTGLIGHIGFGLVYGAWSGWLIHRGYLAKGREKLIYWLLATVSFTFIFLAQGRSGYLVAIVVLLITFWKIWLRQASRHTILLISLSSIALIGVFSIGPAKERIHQTISSIQSLAKGDIEHSEARISLWYSAFKGIREHPWLGLGTGGYSTYAKKVADTDPRISYGNRSLAPGHPHQAYLAAWVRWGPLGLALIIALFCIWIQRGAKAKWTQKDAPLVILSGLALSVHGLSAPSMDEYFSSIYAVLWLGIGLGAIYQQGVK